MKPQLKKIDQFLRRSDLQIGMCLSGFTPDQYTESPSLECFKAVFIGLVITQECNWLTIG